MYAVCIIAFCATFRLTQQSSPTDNSYVAAVVEYEVSENTPGNLERYIQYIGEAAKQKSDIIVFPEATLTRGTHSVSVPFHGLLKKYPVPANKPEVYDAILVSLSRAAMQHRIYVVVNLAEEMNCKILSEEFCPERKVYYFNTNVVFDRSGAVIDRYRKINLFGEAGTSPALQLDLGVFDTDFGVRFGHFICFDLMFQVPAVKILQSRNITDVIFPTMWFSELPYLTAVEIQQAYAYSMDVNLLAAGANRPQYGSAGSGVYSGKAGAVTSMMSGVPTTRLLVATVPKVPGKVDKIFPGPIYNDPKDQDNLLLKTDSSLVNHVTKLLVMGEQEFTLSEKDVVCNFKINLTDNLSNSVQRYYYRAAAYDGIRSFTFKYGGMRSCAIFACTSQEVSDCGHRFPHYSEDSTSVFEDLTITATFPSPKWDLIANDSAYFPISLDTSLMPLPSNQYNYIYKEDKKTSRTTFTIHLATDSYPEIYSFGVWGRVYPRDKDVNVEKSGLNDNLVQSGARNNQDAVLIYSLVHVLNVAVLGMFLYLLFG